MLLTEHVPHHKKMSVDFNYYRDIFGGKSEEGSISPFLSAAERIIWGAVSLGELSERENSAISEAVCVQAEYMERLRENSGGYSSVRLGDFSMSRNASSNESSCDICAEAAAVLDRAGLYYRGGVMT